MIEFDKTLIFRSVFIFLWVEFLWEIYLSIRQHNVFKKTLKPPSELEEHFNEETFKKAREYGLDKSGYGLFHSVFNQIFTSAVIYLNGHSYFWDLTGTLLTSLNMSTDHEILRSLAFMVTVSTIHTLIDLPFTIYYTFWLEERHGFNKQTPSFFVRDTIKKYLLGQAISLPLVAMLICIVERGGEYFFVYLWVFVTCVIVLLMTVYPDYIAPLFDKYSPLPEGELRTQIEALAASIDFPLKKLYVVEGSKRSSHSNAYFYGFFKNKRIVLFDTLIEGYVKEEEDSPTKTKKGCNNPEILAVLGHELGHWKLNHVTKNIIISEVNIMFMFLVFNLLFKYKPLYDAFGFTESQPIFIGLYIVTSYIFSPYNAVLSFLTTLLSRKFEFEADGFAKKLGYAADLKSSLVKLNLDNLGFPVYDWIYSSWHHSHPTLLQRLNALDKTE